jgi:DNA helicase-2/ATP-dependent DNA helicase PcrA
VLAGAGTGKTKVISTRVAYLLQRGVPPSEILAVTFTRKAAAEMKERIEHILKAKPWGLTVSTFHSLGFRILRELSPGKFVVFGDVEKQQLIQSIIGRLRFYLDAETTLHQISRAKNWGLSPEDVRRTARNSSEREFADCYGSYQKQLASQGALDLDDMISLPLDFLLRSEGTRALYQRRWRYILVDEYQDTNRVQYQLTRCILGAHSNLCVVGDDDQSIYGFRGAEVERILSFQEDFPKATAIALQLNYRSHSEILTLANAIISRARRRYPKRLLSHVGPGGRISWRRLGYEEAEAAHIAEQIRGLVETGEFSYRDIAIIARVHKDTRPIHRALQAQELPCAAGKSVGQNAVTVMTLHQSKGLEFPVVFVPALEDNSLPHFHALCEGKEAVEEERRLLYVAVTRAKKRLFLTSSASRNDRSRNVSRFLREVPRTVWAAI